MSADQRPAPIRIAILNDYAIIVEGIAAIFAARPERFEVVYQHSGRAGVDEAEQAVGRLDVDIVLYDPFAAGEPLALRVPRGSATTQRKYVVLSWFRSGASVSEALDLGFSGYLTKTLDDDALADAIEAIHRGEPPAPDVDWRAPAPRRRGGPDRRPPAGGRARTSA